MTIDLFNLGIRSGSWKGYSPTIFRPKQFHRANSRIVDCSRLGRFSHVDVQYGSIIALFTCDFGSIPIIDVKIMEVVF